MGKKGRSEHGGFVGLQAQDAQLQAVRDLVREAHPICRFGGSACRGEASMGCGSQWTGRVALCRGRLRGPKSRRPRGAYQMTSRCAGEERGGGGGGGGSCRSGGAKARRAAAARLHSRPAHRCAQHRKVLCGRRGREHGVATLPQGRRPQQPASGSAPVPGNRCCAAGLTCAARRRRS